MLVGKAEIIKQKFAEKMKIINSDESDKQREEKSEELYKHIVDYAEKRREWHKTFEIF